MIRWFVTLPVVAQITLLCAVITALTTFVTTLIRERPKLVIPFIAVIVISGAIAYWTVPTPSKRILKRIGHGDDFHVVLYKTLGGDLLEHHLYGAKYDPSSQRIKVNGFAAKKQWFENWYDCKGLDKGVFSLAGWLCSVDDYGFVVDERDSNGRSGTIYFDDDVK